MFRISSVLILMLLADTSSLSAQEPTQGSGNIRLQVGLYCSKKEFAARAPSITKPFVVIPIFKSKDSVTQYVFAYDFRFTDYSVMPDDVIGFFDGKDLYYGKGSRFKKLAGGNGKFPYFIDTVDINKQVSLFDAIVEMADKLVAPNTKVFLKFLNEKGNLCEGTPYNIAYIIQDYKELAKAFRKEKEKDISVCARYLEMLNEQYPF